MSSSGYRERVRRGLRRLLLPSKASTPPRWKYRWSIGIYEGTSPLTLRPAEHALNPVLTRDDVSDLDAEFVADPFMVNADGRWYMFFEVANRRLSKGEIALAISADGFKWAYGGVVLTEPFHLSYPYVFTHEAEYYMIPETLPRAAIRLYRSSRFPYEWTCVGTLVSGRPFSDSSIVHAFERWWLFSSASSDAAHDTLRLYWADELTGPWREHPRSPIIAGNPHAARPAGRVLANERSVIRFAQDCAPEYGLSVQAFEVTELTLQTYSERILGTPILQGTGFGWNAAGMHHIDAHPFANGTWIACVDGWCREPLS